MVSHKQPVGPLQSVSWPIGQPEKNVEPLWGFGVRAFNLVECVRLGGLLCGWPYRGGVALFSQLPLFCFSFGSMCIWFSKQTSDVGLQDLKEENNDTEEEQQAQEKHKAMSQKRNMKTHLCSQKMF